MQIALFLILLKPSNRYVCVLSLYGVEYDESDSLKKLHKKLKGYIVRLRKGKRAEARTEKHAAEVEHQKEQIRQNWPQLVSKSLKLLDCFEKKLNSNLINFHLCFMNDV